ncbi:hypothetical protein DL98DRAFT_586027 [Cadophora sp. DSE1049]|nr:hypothetical protein DL98DRAFT_586027 [Cadophora sp. DSE1049]
MYSKKITGAMKACVRRMITTYSAFQTNEGVLVYPNVALYDHIDIQCSSTRPENFALWQSINASVENTASPDVLVENDSKQSLKFDASPFANGTFAEATPAVTPQDPLLCLAQHIAAALVRLECSILAVDESPSTPHVTADQTAPKTTYAVKTGQATTAESSYTESALRDKADSSSPPHSSIAEDLSSSKGQSPMTFGSPATTQSKKRKNEDRNDVLIVKRQRTDFGQPVDQKQPPPSPSFEPKKPTAQKRKKEDDEDLETSQKRHRSSSTSDVGQFGRFDVALLDPALFTTPASSEPSPVVSNNPPAGEVAPASSPCPANLDSYPENSKYQPANQQTDAVTHIPGLGRLSEVQVHTENSSSSPTTRQSTVFQQPEEYPSPYFGQQSPDPMWELPGWHIPPAIPAYAASPATSLSSSDPSVSYHSHDFEFHPLHPQPITPSYEYPSPPALIYQSSHNSFYSEPEPVLHYNQAPIYPAAPAAARTQGSRRIGGEYHYHDPAFSTADNYPAIDARLLDCNNPSGSPFHNPSLSRAPLLNETTLFSYPQVPSTRKPHSAKRIKASRQCLPQFATLFEPVSSVRCRENKLALPRILQDQVSPLPPISSRTPRSPIDDGYDGDDFRESSVDISQGELLLRDDKVLGKYRVSSNKKYPLSSGLRNCVTIILEKEKWFMQELEHDLEEELKTKNEGKPPSTMSSKRHRDDEEDSRYGVKRSRLY